jgi:hypothetical protein
MFWIFVLIVCVRVAYEHYAALVVNRAIELNAVAADISVHCTPSTQAWQSQTCALFKAVAARSKSKAAKVGAHGEREGQAV